MVVYTQTECTKMCASMFMETLAVRAGIVLSLLSVHCIVHKSKDTSTHHVTAPRDGVISGPVFLAVP